MKLKKIIAKLISILFIMFITLIVLIYAFNYYLYKSDLYPSLGKNGIVINQYKETQIYTWGHLVSNNNFGFRDDYDIKVPKPAGTKRILVLGDSFTWGAGLDTSQRYTNILSSSLNHNLVAGIDKVEVVNAAFSGGALTHHRDRLLEIVEKIEPDIIFYGFVLNDPQPRGQNYSIESARFKKTVEPITEKISVFLEKAKLGYVANNLYDYIYNIATKLSILPHWLEALDRTYKPESKEWRGFSQALLDIKEVSDRYRLPDPIFLVLNHGVYSHKRTDYNNPDSVLKKWIEWYEIAENAGKEAGFRTGNIQKSLEDHYSTKIMAVNILDIHPNSDLNKFYAIKAEELIKDSIVVNWWIE